MKIRRYYGYDCNSVDGFNNGYYYDDDYRTSKDPMKDCLSLLKNLWEIDDKENISKLDNGYELITGYFDADGNNLTRQQFTDRDNETDSYKYVYVTFDSE